MLGRLLGHDIAYLRAHFREHSDARLAKALGVSKERVLILREKHGLRRSREETAQIKKQPDIPLPPYHAQAPTPESSAQLDQRTLFGAALVFLTTIAVYLRTLPPTVTGEDSGEFVAAAYTMGIAHPPGYPELNHRGTESKE